MAVATAPARSLEATWPLVERTIRRSLRQAELAIDVLRLDTELNRAKDELEQAIRAEMVRAIQAWVDGRTAGVTLAVTGAMLEPLNRLQELGRSEAALELDRAGYRGVKLPPLRNYAAIPGAPQGRDVNAFLNRGVVGIGVRIENDHVAADFGTAGQRAVAQAVLGIPGARDLASRVVSTALIDGLGQTFEENRDLVSAWEYTAVLDGGTCEVCEPLDGTVYETLEQLFEVLPDFGPNPECFGEGRCRCRAVPAQADAGGGDLPPAQVEEPVPLAEEPAVEALPAWRQEIASLVENVALREIPGFGETALTNEELRAAGYSRLVTSAPGVADAIPGERLVSAEKDVLRAGELVWNQIDERSLSERVELSLKRDAAAGRLDAARAEWKEAQQIYRDAVHARNLEEKAILARLREELIAGGMDLLDAWRAANASEEVAALKAATSPRLLELQRIASEKIEAITAIRKEADAAAEEVAALYRQTLSDVLGEVRSMGTGDSPAWSYSTGGLRGAAKELLEAASRFYPTDWIEKGRLNQIKPVWRPKGRGYHRGYVRGPSDLVISAGERSKIKSDLDGFATAIHELGHHLEHVDPRIRMLEWAFYERRTREAGYGLQEPTRRLGAGYGRNEIYREDKFADRYMGKTYGDSPLSSYEILTMGLEALWTGSYDLDPEMRRFVLGLLATL